MSKEVFLDIGAWEGESLIERARENPTKQYLVIDPEIDPKNLPRREVLPQNLKWITGKIDERAQLPFVDESVDEANLNFVFCFLYGDEYEDEQEALFKEIFPRILIEATRVLKKGGSLLIREPRYMVAIMEPVLTELNLGFSAETISEDEIGGQSFYVQEAYKEFKNGTVEMEPYLIRVKTD